MRVKRQFLEIIKQESDKLEEIYLLPMEISWEDIFDDDDEKQDICVELAYKCMLRVLE